jgi:hypothetical protein
VREGLAPHKNITSIEMLDWIPAFVRITFNARAVPSLASLPKKYL